MLSCLSCVFCVVLSCLAVAYKTAHTFCDCETLSSDVTALSRNHEVSSNPNAEKGSKMARFELESPHAPKRNRKCRECLWAGCALMCFSDRLLVRWGCRSLTILLAGAKIWGGGVVLILFDSHRIKSPPS